MFSSCCDSSPAAVFGLAGLARTLALGELAFGLSSVAGRPRSRGFRRVDDVCRLPRDFLCRKDDAGRLECLDKFSELLLVHWTSSD